MKQPVEKWEIDYPIVKYGKRVQKEESNHSIARIETERKRQKQNEREREKEKELCAQ